MKRMSNKFYLYVNNDFFASFIVIIIIFGFLISGALIKLVVSTYV